MNSCAGEAAKLDYLNGMLSDEERARFEEHLAVCPECRSEILGLQKTAAAVGELTPPSAPETWKTVAKERLRMRSSSLGLTVPSRPAPARRRTNVFQYGAIAVCVTAGLVLLFWPVMGGEAGRRLSGLLAAALGSLEPRAARTAGLIVWILSLNALLFVPPIIDNIYRIVRREGLTGRSASQ